MIRSRCPLHLIKCRLQQSSALFTHEHRASAVGDTPIAAVIPVIGWFLAPSEGGNAAHFAPGDTFAHFGPITSTHARSRSACGSETACEGGQRKSARIPRQIVPTPVRYPRLSLENPSSQAGIGSAPAFLSMWLSRRDIALFSALSRCVEGKWYRPGAAIFDNERHCVDCARFSQGSPV